MKQVFLLQQTADTCMSTCLAMMLGHPAPDMVVSEFHQDFIDGIKTPSQYLISKGLNVKRCYAEQNRTEKGKIYLVIVPSLNLEGEIHAIILDTRADDMIVLDPNHGRWGCYTYTNVRKNLDVEYPGVWRELKGFTFLLELDSDDF